MKEDNNKYLSITDLVQLLSKTLEAHIPKVNFTGEISSCKVYSSGHCYLDIKDRHSLINAVMWRSTLSRLKFKPEAGQEVLCSGNPGIYPARGQLQVIVNSMQLAGSGDLQQKFLELKEKLEREGLFDAERKRSLPFLPKSIGIITSKSGAVIHDMSVKFSERMPATKIYLYDARVQGEGAAEEIAAGVKYFNEKHQVDLLIVARGGGSLEDLWAFNEEVLVRAIFASKIPVISGVGHEPDTTLSDLVADKRAATPTAAAETAVPKRADLIFNLKQYFERLNKKEKWFSVYEQRLDEKTEYFLRSKKLYFETLTHGISQREKLLKLIEPHNLIQSKKKDLIQYSNRIKQAQKIILQQKANRLNALEKHLNAVNPVNVLLRGYSLVSKDGSVVKDSKSLSEGDKLDIRFAEGGTEALVSK